MPVENSHFVEYIDLLSSWDVISFQITQQADYFLAETIIRSTFLIPTLIGEF